MNGNSVRFGRFRSSRSRAINSASSPSSTLAVIGAGPSFVDCPPTPGPGAGLTVGEIDKKYQSLGGCSSVLGAPTTEERPCADGTGRYNDFERGVIYWHPSLGAHEIHGAIHAKWASLGWETGSLGYPARRLWLACMIGNGLKYTALALLGDTAASFFGG